MLFRSDGGGDPLAGIIGKPPTQPGAGGSSGTGGGNDDKTAEPAALSAGAIAGIAIAGVVVVGLIAALIFYLMRRARPAPADTMIMSQGPFIPRPLSRGPGTAFQF